MKVEYCLVLIVTMGLIFGSLVGVAPQVMTEHYSYASTDDEENSGETPDEEASGQQEDDSEIQSEPAESEPQTKSEDEDEEQSISGVSKKDTNSPTIDSRSPNVGTVQIPINTNIKVTFSEPVQTSTVSTSTFQLENTDSAMEVPGSVSLSADGKTATLDPTSDLIPLQSYTISLASSVKDLAGNGLNSENWSFTTEGQSSGGSGGNTTGGSSSNSASNPDVLRGGAEIDILQEAAQYEADSKLLDRLLPILLDKVDMNALIAKADGRKLLEKVLPYLEVRPIVTQTSKSIRYEGGGPLGEQSRATATAQCGEKGILVGGGYSVGTNEAPDINKQDSDSWYVSMPFRSGSGVLTSMAECLKIEVVIAGNSGSTVRSGTVDTGSDLGIKTAEDLDILKQPVP